MAAMPSAVEVVNPIAPEEIAGWSRAMASAFLGDPAGPDAGRHVELLERRWEPARAWGARDRGRWVATLRTERRRLSIPGPGDDTNALPVDALTNVTVTATHRRQGLLRRMLDGSLRAAHERGDPASILIAAEWPIYGRFGYAPATLSADYVLRRCRSGSTCSGDPSRVRAVDREEFGQIAPAVFERARRRRSGQVDRDDPWWSRVLGLDGFPAPERVPANLLVHEGDDGPDGLLAWTSRSGDFGLLPPFGTLDVWWLAAATDHAYRNLWAYLGGIDIVDEIRLSERPVDEPVRWLLPDARTLVMTQHVDFLWLRLLDVPAALSARRYATGGEIVLEVSDDDGDGFAAGRYRLQSDGGDEATCEPTGDPCDLEISQRALASIYLGGYRLPELVIAGSVRERRPGALRRADAMFATPLAPWNATWF